MYRACPQELRDGPWSEACLDAGSSLVVPVRNTSGAVVIGEQAAVYLSATSVCSVSIKPTMVKVSSSKSNHNYSSRVYFLATE